MKKKIYKLVIFLFCFIAFTNFAFADTEVSLQQAISIAVENNQNIKNAKASLEESRVSYEKSSYSASKTKKKYETNSLEYLRNVSKIEASNNLNWEIAQRKYEKLVREEKQVVEKQYYKVLHAQKQVDIYEESLKLAQNLYEKTKKEFEVGKVANLDVTSSELNYENVKKDLSLSKNTLKVEKMNLNNILGYDLNQEITLKGNLEYILFENLDSTSLVDQALENDLEVLNAKGLYESAKIDMDIEASMYSDIVFTYREKEAALKQSEQNLQGVKNTVKLGINNKYLDFIKKEDSIKSIEKSIELAQKKLNYTILTYDLGKSVLTDVQTSQINLESQKLLLANSILDYNMSVLTFKESIGIE